ncbi:hypothetical protein T4C_12853, partial [Trichinella pseudospiralis]
LVQISKILEAYFNVPGFEKYLNQQRTETNETSNRVLESTLPTGPGDGRYVADQVSRNALRGTKCWMLRGYYYKVIEGWPGASPQADDFQKFENSTNF